MERNDNNNSQCLHGALALEKLNAVQQPLLPLLYAAPYSLWVAEPDWLNGVQQPLVDSKFFVKRGCRTRLAEWGSATIG